MTHPIRSSLNYSRWWYLSPYTYSLLPSSPSSPLKVNFPWPLILAAYDFALRFPPACLTGFCNLFSLPVDIQVSRTFQVALEAPGVILVHRHPWFARAGSFLLLLSLIVCVPSYSTSVPRLTLLDTSPLSTS